MSTRNPASSKPPEPSPADRAFARAACRYLLRGEPPAGVVERLAEAFRLHPGLSGGSPALRLASRRPVLLGPLDAACALARRDDPLRRRLLAAAAVLETDPLLADRFLPPRRPSPAHALGAAGAALLRAGVLAVVGLPILLAAERFAR